MPGQRCGWRFAGRAHPRTGSPPPETVRFGRSWVRLAPWRGDDRVGHLVTASGAPLDAAAVGECLERLRALGYRSVLTSAMAEREQPVFAEQGFVVRERLHLLSLELGDEPMPSTKVVVDTVGRDEYDDVLALDRRAFTPFWRLEAGGLRDALVATVACQFRATRDDAARADSRTGRRVSRRSTRITGYAITGWAGTDAYLQRIAVDPCEHGNGYGRALVDDALHFAWREGAHRVFVNTQADNDRALALYEARGFRLRPPGLSVMERAL